MAFAMPLRSHKAAAILSFCLALGGATTASAATYYGPPYKVQSFRGVGSFESIGAAVNFLVGKIQAPCQQDPKCTKPPVVTVRYGTDGWAATIYVNGSVSDNVFASEILIGQPQKNFGGCQKRCSAGLGSATDGTGARGLLTVPQRQMPVIQEARLRVIRSIPPLATSIGRKRTSSLRQA